MICELTLARTGPSRQTERMIDVTDKRIAKTMAMETVHVEQTRDEPLEEPGVRKNQVRSRLIAVRFAPEEATELERQARDAGTSVSALIRGRALRDEGH